MPDENCKNKNPLRLKGIAQEKRFPENLDPTLIKIDGKTSADYQRILQDLAKLTQFYNNDNLRDGDWENFFLDNDFSGDKPHIALFNAFVELMQYAQDDLNDISAKHLEFYYEEVLQIAKKAETADEAHVLFALANNIDDHLVETGTLLRADKDALGQRRLYALEDDLVVNRITVEALKSVFVQTDEDTGIVNVYSAEIANSLDGNGEDLDEENPKWAPFGQNQSNLETPSMSLAAMGFAIATEFLLLREGARSLTLTVNFQNPHEITDLLASDFTIYLSGEEEWLQVEPTSIDYSSESQLIITIDLSEEDAPIVEYNEELYAESLNTDKPVLKLLINQSADRNTYGQLAGLNVDNIDLSATVTGMREFVLQNETGTVDPAKPFEPFGSLPLLGSEFYVGSREVFGKKLGTLDFTIEWLDLPDLSDYFEEYKSGITKSDFTVKISALKKRTFKDNVLHGGASEELFADTISLTDLSDVFENQEAVEEFDEFTNDLKNGFIKMEITGPNETELKAFGHKQYQNLYVTRAINLSNESSTDPLPNEPLIPKVKSLSINYTASHRITLNDSVEEGLLNGQFFHIGPFGLAKKEPSSENIPHIFPTFSNEGSFYIGLDKVVLPQNISLLFQVSDGSANPNKLPATINWAFLIDNEWQDFESTTLISDSSNGLINSGIIVIELPKELNNTNTWLPSGNYWIRASIESDSDSVCQLVAVHPQAVTAKFENNDNDLGHLEDALPAETINKLNSSQSVIREVTQPYASFNGKLPEEGKDYYRRVAERLRHKNRAITIWDYERIVLEEFPSVYKVKCLNHTRMTENYSEQAPGHVSLVVVSNLRNQNAINPLQPTTSIATLYAIKDFLLNIRNPFIELHVKNPDFEEIQVEFNVKLHEGKDKGFYKKQLNEDIKVHLSPWAYTEGEDISFEGLIHKSKIINFIEELDYVDYLTCFKMYQIIDGITTDLEDINEAEPSKSSAILVSASDHSITVLDTDDCTCDGDNVQTEVITDGISTMTVNLDLIVNKP